MKVTGLYVYPVKALRGIALPAAELGPQGVRYDRRFMLLTTKRSKKQTLTKMQLSSFPECALFSQEIVDAKTGEAQNDGDKVVVVSYHPPEKNQNPDAKGDEKTEAPPTADNNRIVMSPVQHPPLRIPLDPDFSSLKPLDIDLHGSPVQGYRMGDSYDAWFSACFGFDVVLVYIGDGQRKVLGETLKTGVPVPRKRTAKIDKEAKPGGLFSVFLSYLVGAWLALLAALGVRANDQDKPDEPWITFSDCAPFLVTTESSLRNVSARLSVGVDVPMYKFRPNIVVDGEGEEEWAEDYWGELAVTSSGGSGGSGASKMASASSTPSLSRSRSASSLSTAAASDVEDDHEKPSSVRLLLTSNCARCTSLNVDYATGTRAAGELGEVLKRLSKDRRVDSGNKYSPVFGRYAFLDQRGDETAFGSEDEDEGIVRIAVGDEVTVTRRNAERTIWDWPDL